MGARRAIRRCGGRCNQPSSTLRFGRFTPPDGARLAGPSPWVIGPATATLARASSSPTEAAEMSEPRSPTGRLCRATGMLRTVAAGRGVDPARQEVILMIFAWACPVTPMTGAVRGGCRGAVACPGCHARARLIPLRTMSDRLRTCRSSTPGCLTGSGWPTPSADGRPPVRPRLRNSRPPCSITASFWISCSRARARRRRLKTQGQKKQKAASGHGRALLHRHRHRSSPCGAATRPPASAAGPAACGPHG